MREIEFIAKTKNNGKWVSGYYYKHQPPLQCIVPKDHIPEECEHYIIQTGFADWNMPRPIKTIEINAETLSQFTGLYDKKNNKVYENNIIYAEGWTPKYGIIIENGFCVMFDKDGNDTYPTELYHFYDSLGCHFEVVGNVFDNLDLMDKKKQ